MDAFGKLYELLSPRSLFVAMEIVKNKQDAEDILQESYVKMLEKIGSLDKPESFVSWFHHIVADKSKDSLKKKKGRIADISLMIWRHLSANCDLRNKKSERVTFFEGNVRKSSRNYR